jgi:hypothetical protein
VTTAIEDTDIEAELSYAFLHAVASQSQATCAVAQRLSDNRGIDAVLTSWGPFAEGAKIEVDLKVQLKATIAQPTDLGSHFSYSLKKVSQYDDLRAMAYSAPRILVVLFLPRDKQTWLSVTEQSLALKRAAYWVSLAGAAEVATASPTIHIPKQNLLTPETLRKLFSDLSIGKFPTYVPKEIP